MVKSPSFLSPSRKYSTARSSEVLRFGFMVWQLTTMAMEISYQEGLCKLSCILFRLESQNVSQLSNHMSCHPVLSFCCLITAQKSSVGHTVFEHRDGASISWCRPFPLVEQGFLKFCLRIALKSVSLKRSDLMCVLLFSSAQAASTYPSWEKEGMSCVSFPHHQVSSSRLSPIVTHIFSDWS